MNTRTKVVAVVLAVALFGCCGAAEAFSLVENGEAKVRIVKVANAEKAIDFFVDEAKKCGVEFNVIDAPDPNGCDMIFEIGERPLVEMDAYEILPQNGDLIIRCTKRSVRWAVNRILKDAFGVRWLFPNKEFTGGEDLNEYPHVTSASVPADGIRQKPYDFCTYRYPSWRLRGFERYDCFRGRALSHNIFADVFRWYKYAFDDSWPDEIMPIRNGKMFIPPKPKKFPPVSARMAPYEYRDAWNICFTNPKAVELAIAETLEDLKQRPDHIVRALHINDNGGMCECARCRAAIGDKRNSAGYPDWSVPYWTFVNKVAAGVAKERDDIWFTAAGYREVVDPPPFRLDPHVHPSVCMEVMSMLDPVMYERYMNTLGAWCKVADLVELYDYNYGIEFFLMPRVYFTEWSRLMREIYRAYPSVNAYECESNCDVPFDGPRLQVMAAVLRDVDVDPWEVVHDWCVDTVGSAAAPELESYYRFWDDYWRGDGIRKTAWFKNSVRNIYMQLGERSTHAFALKRGDIAKCRRWMEGVVARAVTPMQKKRAKVLMDYFELVEDAAVGLLAEYVEPDSKVKDAQTAVEMLEAIPNACAAIERYSVHANAIPMPELKKKLLSPANLAATLALTLQHKNDPSVKAAYARLAADASIPAEIRGMLKIWGGAKAENLVPNGAFEQDGPLPENMWVDGPLKGARRTNADATDGCHSLELHLANFRWLVPVQANKTYMLMFDAKAVKGSGEGRFSAILSPCRANGNPHDHFYARDNVLPGGEWVTMSLVAKTKPYTKSLRIQIYTKNYEPDETVLVDNVRLVCLDDLK